MATNSIAGDVTTDGDETTLGEAQRDWDKSAINRIGVAAIADEGLHRAWHSGTLGVCHKLHCRGCDRSRRCDHTG